MNEKTTTPPPAATAVVPHIDKADAAVQALMTGNAGPVVAPRS
jgi:hypothetical protein